MKPYTKMMLMTNARSGEKFDGRSGGRENRSGERSGGRMGYMDDNYSRMDYNGPESNYDGMENRFRDRRGREHYDNGRFAPHSEMDGVESRRYRRTKDGRFKSENMPGMDYDGMRNHYDMDDRYDKTESAWPNRPFPVYERGGEGMNQIGFRTNGSEVRSDYRMDAHYPEMNEMNRGKSERMSGYSASEPATMTREIAEEWTANMKNEDGTKGPHWTIDQIKQLMMQKGIQGDPWTFYAIMNAMYSDYCAVMKKHGCHTAEMYADMALAWINDKDAMPGKAAAYYEYVVKK